MPKLVSSETFKEIESKSSSYLNNFDDFKNEWKGSKYKPKKIKYEETTKIENFDVKTGKYKTTIVKNADPNRLVFTPYKGNLDEWINMENNQINTDYMEYKNIENLENQEINYYKMQENQLDEDEDDLEQDTLSPEELEKKNFEKVQKQVSLLSAARKLNENRSLGSRLFNWYRNYKNNKAIENLENSIKDSLKASESKYSFEEISVMANYVNEKGNYKYDNFKNIQGKDEIMNEKVALYANAKKRDSIFSSISKHLFWTDAYKKAHEIDKLGKLILDENPDFISENDLKDIVDITKFTSNNVEMTKEELLEKPQIPIDNYLGISMGEELDSEFNLSNEENTYEIKNGDYAQKQTSKVNEEDSLTV